MVTGAASGTGAAISVAFAQEGAQVALVDLAEPAAAEPVLAAVRGHDRQAVYVQTDVADEQAVSEMARSVLAHFGRVDVLVNNAGIFSQSLVQDMPVADWDRVLAVNLRGLFWVPARCSGRCLTAAPVASPTSPRSWARSAARRSRTTRRAKPVSSD